MPVYIGTNCYASSACVQTCKQSSCAERWGSNGESISRFSPPATLPPPHKTLQKNHDAAPSSLLTEAFYPELRLESNRVVLPPPHSPIQRYAARPSGAVPPLSPLPLPVLPAAHLPLPLPISPGPPPPSKSADGCRAARRPMTAAHCLGLAATVKERRWVSHSTSHVDRRPPSWSHAAVCTP
jgi:hypothetical protein